MLAAGSPWFCVPPGSLMSPEKSDITTASHQGGSWRVGRKPLMLTVSKLFVKMSNKATDPELAGGLGLLQHLAFPSTQSSVPLCVADGGP